MERLQTVIEKIAPEWEKLGTKLGTTTSNESPNTKLYYLLCFAGYKGDEIEWFKNENPKRFDQAAHMMNLWFEDDEDANLDNLLYILEGLEMNEAAEAVRAELSAAGET